MRSQQTQFVRLHQTNLFYSIRNRILRWTKRSVMLVTVISKIPLINLSPFKTIMMNELQMMLGILKNLRFAKKEILTLNLIQISLWHSFLLSLFSASKRGTLLVVELICYANHNSRLESQIQIKRYCTENLLLCAAKLFSGNTFQHIKEMMDIAKIRFFLSQLSKKFKKYTSFLPYIKSFPHTGNLYILNIHKKTHRFV